MIPNLELKPLLLSSSARILLLHFLSSAEDPSPMDFLKQFGLIYNVKEDTFTRLDRVPTITTEAHNSVPGQTIFTQDFPLNPTHKTWLRLYKPITPPPDGAKLPLILYIHGGGFIMCSVSESDVHDVCAAMAKELPAVILSLEYRLAPESRLPAAYEDTLEALLWVQNQAVSENPMLKDVVDFSQVYLMGSSAGGNIAYHAGLGALSLELKPLLIKGYIFDHPYFSGEERSGSEMRLADDPVLPLAVCDVMWELSLPKGCDRGHEYCNPLVEGSYKDKIGMLGRCFVNMRGGDLLVDYQMEFVKMLEGNGVCVVIRFIEEGYHCMDTEEIRGENGKDLLIALKQFISDSNE